VPTKRSAIAFARGARTGVLMIHGDPQLAVRCIHPEFVNEESVNEPNDDYVASIGSSAGLELSPGRHNQRHLRQPV
jgi:hypothetical protein